MMMEAEPAAPAPEQVMAYVLLPAVEMVTASDPEVDVWAVQLAEQAVALVEDQVKVEALLTNTDEVSAESDTVAAGTTGVEPPPPPPPPQAEANRRIAPVTIMFLIFWLAMDRRLIIIIYVQQ